jgi:hypothetical protein
MRSYLVAEGIASGVQYLVVWLVVTIANRKSEKEWRKALDRWTAPDSGAAAPSAAAIDARNARPTTRFSVLPSGWAGGRANGLGNPASQTGAPGRDLRSSQAEGARRSLLKWTRLTNGENDRYRNVDQVDEQQDASLESGDRFAHEQQKRDERNACNWLNLCKRRRSPANHRVPSGNPSQRDWNEALDDDSDG